MRERLATVGALLLGSGLTSLVYQIAWMRELRLIFGFSTAASAAVVAIFLGGLGLGGKVLGRRADSASRPLFFYGCLELAIAGSAAATPAFLWLVRKTYLALGGSFVLGSVGGAAVRLALSALVLLVPTFLMGGTLPAAARAVETDEDSDRRRMAFLYGANTLGAVIGTSLATFWLLEALGTRATLWLACAFNALIGLIAVWQGRALVARDADPARASDAERTRSIHPQGGALAPRRFVLAAACVVGFAFTLMELVWYRMLAPLLGGTTYTFGLILAVALAGIGLGAALYARSRGSRPATLSALAITTALEAVCVAVPFAVGDRLALVAVFFRSFGAIGLPGYAVGWTGITCLVVLPAAIVAGIQFPQLVALLGKGREGVGEDVGLAYAWNTLGAIGGSLAGGFGLVPLLSATGAWKAVVVLLAGLSGWTFVLAVKGETSGRRSRLALPAIVASLLLILFEGPTAVWRHTPIGAGRVRFEESSPEAVAAWQRDQKRGLLWDADGKESSVALLKTEAGVAFAVNGKVDGNSREDAATQVMSGLIGAVLHPGAREALVVGLGTGSTAGWLGAVPSIARVDVIELEAAVLKVARDCALVNRDVLSNPRVKITIGDARELLLTTRHRYDVIFSEPSNPYRAGISSLFTREFYEAVRSRLSGEGIFIQWLQAYEVDAQTVRTIYATLGSVFPFVETYSGKKDDLLLLATMRPIRYSSDALRKRLSEEPFARAMLDAWRATGLEGFLSHYVARDSLTRAIVRAERGRVNSDDRNLVEFAFARSLGTMLFQSDELRRIATQRGENRPVLDGSPPDEEILRWQGVSGLTEEGLSAQSSDGGAENARRLSAHASFLAGNLGQVRGDWLSTPWQPIGPLELTMLGEALADGGEAATLTFVEAVRHFQPAEADAILARYLWSQGDFAGCSEATANAFRRYRQDPWPLVSVMRRLLAVAAALPSKDAALAAPLYELLSPPFALSLLDDERLLTRVALARPLGSAKVAEAIEALEPNFPWKGDLLEERAHVYEEVGNPRAGVARKEFEAFARHAPAPFSKGLETVTVP